MILSVQLATNPPTSNNSRHIRKNYIERENDKFLKWKKKENFMLNMYVWLHVSLYGRERYGSRCFDDTFWNHGKMSC